MFNKYSLVLCVSAYNLDRDVLLLGHLSHEDALQDAEVYVAREISADSITTQSGDVYRLVWATPRLRKQFCSDLASYAMRPRAKSARG